MASKLLIDKRRPNQVKYDSFSTKEWMDCTGNYLNLLYCMTMVMMMTIMHPL